MQCLFDRIFTHLAAGLAFSPQRAITLCWISDTADAGEISPIMDPAFGKGELSCVYYWKPLWRCLRGF